MSILTCFLLVLEKNIIIRLNRYALLPRRLCLKSRIYSSSLWEKIRTNIFSEAVLQRLYSKMKKGKAPSKKLYKTQSTAFLGGVAASLWENKPDFYTVRLFFILLYILAS